MKSINVGKEFSRYPAGRFPTDGKFNGETFRKKFLVTSLADEKITEIILDDAVDYGSSFLEEAFGGLVRLEKFKPSEIFNKIVFKSTNPFLIEEIRDYINSAIISD